MTTDTPARALEPARIDAVLAAPHAAGPDRLALRDHDGRAITRAELADAVDAVAAGLSQRGLRPGDRLLIVAENAAVLIALVMAASRLGAVAVPVNARLTGPELAAIAAHARPRLTVYLTGVSAEARAHAAGAGAQEWRSPMGELHVTGPDDAADPVSPAADLAVILYTSGTTGAPKGVMLTHANLWFGARASVAARRIGDRDALLAMLPMSHVFGLTSIMLAGLLAGAELRIAARFSAARVLAELGQGATVLSGTPQMHALIMAHAAQLGLARAPGETLRYVSSGAAPLDPDWKRRAEAFYGQALQNGYGLTETTAGVTITDCDMGAPDVSVGRPLPGVEVRIRNPGADGVGEVATRGPHVMAGYFHDPAATAAAFDADGFFGTGDLGRIDAGGNLHIVGRARELIIRGGFSVYPAEIEAALNQHPCVVQSAVIGRRTPTGDEEVLAFCQVATPDAVSPAELAAFVATRIAPYKRPARIVTADALPAAPTGKILKSRLLDHFAAELAQPDLHPERTPDRQT